MKVAVKNQHQELPKPEGNYPILLFLAFFGFPLCGLKTEEHGHRWSKILLLVYRIAWGGIQLAMALITSVLLMASWESYTHDTGHYVVMTTNTTVAFLSYLALCWHEKNIRLLLCRVEEHWRIFLSPTQRQDSQKQMYRAGVGLSVIYCATLLATFGAACFVHLFGTGAQKPGRYAAVVAAGNDSRVFTDIKEALLKDFDIIRDLRGTILHLIFCEAFYLFLGIFLVHTSLAVSACFQQVEYKNDFLPDQKEQAEAILTFKVLHLRASELVEECDKSVAWLNFLWVVNTLMVCCAVYTVKYEQQVHHILLGILIVEHLFSFFATFTASSLVNSQITASTYIGIPSFEESIAHSHFNEELATLMKMFVLYVGKMAIEIRGITVWGLFNVERGMMLTVGAAMLTYSVIVYDIGD